MNIEEILNQIILTNMKKTLSNALIQIEALFGMLEPHMDEGVVEKLRADFNKQLESDLMGN
jgi:hypothetical protein